MYIVARAAAAVKHREKIDRLIDRKCRILYHEYGAATDGTPGRGPVIGGQPPAGAVLGPKMAVQSCPQKGVCVWST
ncbi:hypothetical protein ANACOL_01425 [Anaerotruncus colihominis DSM 17241]|uniref:Uncharacterized protein n=1 Tax=Anaerotruncus colihominis DSM 17241 TaxID=445972 RepID=B0P9L9_9FIRM|nr:hypothetical protein ANACOL_01425 [Anaerotruncus colihominis DSM 17241]